MPGKARKKPGKSQEKPGKAWKNSGKRKILQPRVHRQSRTHSPPSDSLPYDCLRLYTATSSAYRRFPSPGKSWEKVTKKQRKSQEKNPRKNQEKAKKTHEKAKKNQEKPRKTKEKRKILQPRPTADRVPAPLPRTPSPITASGSSTQRPALTGASRHPPTHPATKMDPPT